MYVFTVGDYLARLILNRFRVESEFKEMLSRQRSVSVCRLTILPFYRADKSDSGVRVNRV